MSETDILEPPPEVVEVKLPRFPAGFSGPTEGAALAKLVEYSGVQLSPEALKELEALQNLEAVAALLKEAELGDTVKVKPLNAQRIFGNFLMAKMDMQPLLMSWWYQTLAASQDAIKFCQEELRKPRPALKDGVVQEPSYEAIIKHYNNAILGQMAVLEKMQDMAREVGLMRPPTIEKPKNKAPDVFSQTNVIVQGDGVRVGVVAGQSQSKV